MGAAVAGCFLVALVLVDAFNTLVLARRTRHVFRIARLYYHLTWRPLAALARKIQSPLRRESILGVYGPMSLLLLIALWGMGLVLAFGLLQWSVAMKSPELTPTFAHDVYLSSRALVTLNDGDPQNAASQLFSVCEGGLGLAFLGLVVGYLPVLYQSFAKRELAISLLDARAGSPPSAGGLLASIPFEATGIIERLEKWESWMAQLLENQISFPMLGYFRSQHSNQSWLTALVAVLDCATAIGAVSDGSLRIQADLTAAMGRHVLSDVVVIFGLEQACKKTSSSRLSDRAPQIRGILQQRPGIFDVGKLSDGLLEERVAGYPAERNAPFGLFDGQQVFTIGMFASNSGLVNIQPIVRTGTIAHIIMSVPMPFKDGERNINAHLIEAWTWGGMSGSPVFVYDERDKSPKMAFNPGYGPGFELRPALLGVLCGSYPINVEVSGQSVDVNSGIGIVAPMGEVKKMLTGERFRKHREEIAAAPKKQKPVTLC